MNTTRRVFQDWVTCSGSAMEPAGEVVEYRKARTPCLTSSAKSGSYATDGSYGSCGNGEQPASLYRTRCSGAEPAFRPRTSSLDSAPPLPRGLEPFALWRPSKCVQAQGPERPFL